MDSFYIHVLAEDHVFLRGDCLSLTLPIVDGLYGIQAHHSNMISAVVPGTLSCTMADGSIHSAAVSNGLVKVEDNDVLVLVESAETPENLGSFRARLATEEAEAAKENRKAMMEYGAAQASLIRASSRLRTKGRYKPEDK